MEEKARTTNLSTDWIDVEGHYSKPTEFRSCITLQFMHRGKDHTPKRIWTSYHCLLLAGFSDVQRQLSTEKQAAAVPLEQKQKKIMTAWCDLPTTRNPESSSAFDGSACTPSTAVIMALWATKERSRNDHRWNMKATLFPWLAKHRCKQTTPTPERKSLRYRQSTPIYSRNYIQHTRSNHSVVVVDTHTSTYTI